MWTEYFKQILNVGDVREANINIVEDKWNPEFGELNETAISIEEVRVSK